MSIKIVADAAWASLLALIVALVARFHGLDHVRVAFEMGRKAERISRERAELNETTVQFNIDGRTVELIRGR